VIDTSVLVAGVTAFKSWRMVSNRSVSFLRDSIEVGTFTWLVNEEILSEYEGVIERLGVREISWPKSSILRQEAAEFVTIQNRSPDLDDKVFYACAEQGRGSFVVTLNWKHFPQKNLAAKVISPA
jgi:PIN domain-containing protein